MRILHKLVPSILFFSLANGASSQIAHPEVVKAAYKQACYLLGQANELLINCDSWHQEKSLRAGRSKDECDNQIASEANNLRYCAQGCRLGVLALKNQLVNKQASEETALGEEVLNSYTKEQLYTWESELNVFRGLWQELMGTHYLCKNKQPSTDSLLACFVELKKNFHIFQRNDFATCVAFERISQESPLSDRFFEPRDIIDNDTTGWRFCQLLKVVPESNYISCTNERAQLAQQKLAHQAEIQQLSQSNTRKKNWIVALGITNLVTLATTATLALHKSKKLGQKLEESAAPQNDTLEKLLESQAAR